MNVTPKLSIVLPSYNEKQNLQLIIPEIKSILEKVNYDNYEIIIVDDGSTDGTDVLLATLTMSESRLKTIFLSRNFGHQAAVSAGLDMSNGAAVIVMDSDFQHPPQLIPTLLDRHCEGFDIVLCVRARESWSIKRFFSELFYKTINILTKYNFKPNIADFGLLSRKAVDTLKRMPEKDRFLRGLVQWVGFSKSYVEYHVANRKNGRPKYTFAKSFELALSGITSFSGAPLRLAIWSGLFVSLFGFCYLLYILFIWLYFPAHLITGWSSLISIILIIGGFQLLILGIIGEYLFRIYFEVKGRPLYIIKSKLNFFNEVKKSEYGIDNQ